MTSHSNDRGPHPPELLLSFLDPIRVLARTKAVTRYVNEERASSSPMSFWTSMCGLLHADLVDVPVNPDVPRLVWYEGNSDPFRTALRSLMGNVDPPDDASYPGVQRPPFEEAFRNTLARLRRVLPNTYVAFSEVIRFVILARRSGYGGGTVSSRIGLIWLAPEPTWTEDEWLENLVHEFVHNCLFLEDMVDTVFLAGGDRLEADDARAMSAIRQVRRGYDKSYHSAFVSFSIIQLYLRLGKVHKAKEFLSPLLICVDDLTRNMSFISSHGRDLLVELADRVLEVRNEIEPAVVLSA